MSEVEAQRMANGQIQSGDENRMGQAKQEAGDSVKPKKPKKPRKRRSTTTPELTALRHKMYNEYIVPHQHMIYCWIKKHTHNYGEVDDYYAEMLRDFYLYIDTYDPKKNIIAWIIVALQRKMAYFERRTEKTSSVRTTLSEYYVSTTEPAALNPAHLTDMSFEDLKGKVGDEVLQVLNELDPTFRNAFLMKAAGYLPREIALIEQRAGNLPSGNVESIRTRIRLAQRYLQSNLTRDGKRRKNESTPSIEDGESCKNSKGDTEKDDGVRGDKKHSEDRGATS